MERQNGLLSIDGFEQNSLIVLIVIWIAKNNPPISFKNNETIITAHKRQAS